MSPSRKSNYITTVEELVEALKSPELFWMLPHA